LDVTIRIWVDIDGSRPIRVTASCESWRLQDEKIPNDERRRSFFTLNNCPGKLCSP
jgi:hypothetical protein